MIGLLGSTISRQLFTDEIGKSWKIMFQAFLRSSRESIDIHLPLPTDFAIGLR